MIPAPLNPLEAAGYALRLAGGPADIPAQILAVAAGFTAGLAAWIRSESRASILERKAGELEKRLTDKFDDHPTRELCDERHKAADAALSAYAETTNRRLVEVRDDLRHAVGRIEALILDNPTPKPRRRRRPKPR